MLIFPAPNQEAPGSSSFSLLPHTTQPPKIADCFSMFVYFRSLLILVRHCQTVFNPPPPPSLEVSPPLQLQDISFLVLFSSQTFLRKIQHPPADSPGLIHSKFCRVLYHLVTFMKIYRSQGGRGRIFCYLAQENGAGVVDEYDGHIWTHLCRDGRFGRISRGGMV